MGKLKDQLAGIAALIAAVVAIGGGFTKYGELTTRLNEIESRSTADYSADIAVLEEKVEALSVKHGHTKILVNEKINVLENASKTVDLSIVAVLEEKIAQLESHEHEVNHSHTGILINKKEIELLKVQIEEIKVKSSNPLATN